jgi:Flp pilus assembly protein TadG
VARRHGIATVEFAVVMAFLIPLLLVGLWEIGRVVEVSQILSNAAREGARRAAAGGGPQQQWDDKEITARVLEYLQNEGLPTQNVTVSIANIGPCSTAPQWPSAGSANYNPANPNLLYLDRLQVTVTIPYRDVEWTSVPTVTNPATLSGNAIWAATIDRSFPAPNPPPGY